MNNLTKTKSITLIALIIFVANLKVNAQNIDACKTIIKVGITGVFSDQPSKKAKRHAEENDVRAMTQILTDALSKGTKVKAISVIDFKQERDFIEQSKTDNKTDLLLYVEMETKSDKKGLVGCFIDPRLCPTSFPVSINLTYKVIDTGNGKTIKNGKVSGKDIDPKLGAEVVANQLNEEVGNLAREETVDTLSVERLSRKQACYTQFPTNPKSLLMDYDISSSNKTISFKYRIQDGLWRIDRSNDGKKYSMGFNGEVVWDSTGRTVQTAKGESGLEFFLGDFMSESGIEDADNRVMNSKVLTTLELVNGVNCYVIESTTSANTFIKAYYNTKSGSLLKKSKLDQNRNNTQDFYFENYQDIGNGVMFPLKISSKGKSGDVAIIFKQSQGIVINLNFDEKVFLSK